MKRAVERLHGFALGAATMLVGCGGHEHPPVIIDYPPADASADVARRDAAADHVGGDADAAPVADGGFRTAPHAALPSMALYNPGAVLMHPQLVTVTYSDDAYIDDVERLGDLLVDGSWITATGAEYGVGTGTHLAKVRLAETAPTWASDADVVSMLLARIADATLPAPGGDNADVLYMVYYPSTTVISATGLGTSCEEFDGYHSSSTNNGVPFAYAVVADCDVGLAQVSEIASHELIEAATDPYIHTLPGWRLGALLTDPWWVERGEEVGDLCQSEERPAPGDHYLLVQRSWSNAGAAMDHPCVPAPQDEVYFNVSPTDDAIEVVPAGSQITVTLVGWSTAPTGDWALAVAPDRRSDLGFAAMNPTLDRDSINNGVSASLTLTVPSTAPSRSVGSVRVYSGYRRYWPVAFRVR